MYSNVFSYLLWHVYNMYKVGRTKGFVTYSPTPPTDSIGSPFTFDFGRSSLRPKKPFLRDMMGSGKSGRSADSADPPVETQLRLQSQQEELGRLQQEQAQLREELASQKVCCPETLVVCLFAFFPPCVFSWNQSGTPVPNGISLVLFCPTLPADGHFTPYSSHGHKLL